MFDPKAEKQPKPKVDVGPKSSSSKMTMMAGVVPSQDMIRDRAYELYERRGCEHGQDQQDWLLAEREILKH